MRLAGERGFRAGGGCDARTAQQFAAPGRTEANEDECGGVDPVGRRDGPNVRDQKQADPKAERGGQQSRRPAAEPNAIRIAGKKNSQDASPPSTGPSARRTPRAAATASTAIAYGAITACAAARFQPAFSGADQN